MEQIRLKAYAKINLTLDVVGRRSDGYHLLQSIMQSVSLADSIILRKREQGIRIRSQEPGVPVDEKNICWQAANAFANYTGLAIGADIELIKGIPLQAGLGGGSADAAGVLVGLNKLYGANLTLAELQKIGLKIGADVPFCLQGGTAFVQGIGEQVTSLPPFPEVSIVLVKPADGVSTAEVYQGLSAADHGGQASLTLARHLQEQTPLIDLGKVLANTLELVTKQLVPEIMVWKERLMQEGAVGALMSGSGTTVFGLFPQHDLAHRFKEAWSGKADLFLVQPVSRGVVQVNGGD